MTEIAERRPYAHPETGEVLETADDFRRALAEIEESMVPFWRLRHRIQQAYADRHDGELPERLRQTDRQQIVAHCPRCRRVISEDDAYEVALVERLRRQRSL